MRSSKASFSQFLRIRRSISLNPSFSSLLSSTEQPKDTVEAVEEEDDEEDEEYAAEEEAAAAAEVVVASILGPEGLASREAAILAIVQDGRGLPGEGNQEADKEGAVNVDDRQAAVASCLLY